MYIMELPEEIVSIIREYSRPRFKYFREYKRILKLKYLSDWPSLHQVLLRRPEEVVPAMLAFETASLVFEPLRNRYNLEDKDYYQKRDNLIQADDCLYHAIYMTTVESFL
jgi:hypothetical protein